MITFEPGQIVTPSNAVGGHRHAGHTATVICGPFPVDGVSGQYQIEFADGVREEWHGSRLKPADTPSVETGTTITLSPVVAPFVNMNGTSERELADLLQEVYCKLNEARDALKKAAPNGRDYCQGGTVYLDQAIDQYRARLLAIEALKDHVETEVGLIFDRKQREKE